MQQIQGQIQAKPDTSVTVDLVGKKLICGDLVVDATINEGARQMFIKGSWDNCAQLIQNQSAIKVTATNLPYVAW